ncbi:MAG: hypothetical protein HOP15_00115 [Planctomycetes bacterium]|nr:hypothetical protein [Planctomycetota bacterium]
MTLLALALVLVAGAPAPELQPKTYSSPSGGWSLRVEPLTREGSGEADYTLTGGGREAWRKRHPFALWEAAVTDGGRVGGYAYVDAVQEMASGGSLHVVVLSPKGEVLIDEVHERTMSRMMHAAGEPLALGMFVQHELDRLVVRIAADADYQSGESWWAYDLAAGKPLFQEHPKVLLGLEGAEAWGVRAIPKTPLVLVHWYRHGSDAASRSLGATFQMLDAERRPVWNLDLPHDYETRGDREAESLLIGEVFQNGAILATDSGEFVLRHAAEGQRVTYSVACDAQGRWTVSEAKREPFGPPETTGPVLAQPFRPRLLRAVSLGPPAPPKAEIRDILAFGFDAEGHVRFARGEEGGITLVRLSEAGGLRSATRVPAFASDVRRFHWYPLAGSRWLAVAPTLEEDTKARAWRVDEGTGAYEELAEFPGQDVARVAELPGERLLVLSTWHSAFTMTDTLSACAETGETLWSIDEDYQDPAKLFAPQDVAVTSGGRVVVLDNIRKVLQVFTDQGQYVETIDLATAWGREPGYPSSIVRDRDGGVLVHADGEPPLWRMALDGTVRAKFDARMTDGVPRIEYRRSLRVAPDGRLWTTDGHELVRLDENGVVDQQLGPPVLVDWLEDPGRGVIDSAFGCVLILDDRTRTLHVFDDEGERVWLGRPRPEDLDELCFPLRLGRDSAGGAFAAESRFANHHVRFGPDGSSRGTQKLEGGNVAFVPGRDAYWCVVESAPVRHGPRGELELALPKLADGNWWRSIEDLSVAADGSLAVLDLPGRSYGIRRSPGAGLVARFDAQGRALGQHVLPDELDPSGIAHSGRWVLLTRFSEPAWLLDTRDGSLRGIELVTEGDPDSERDWGLSPSGNELWVLILQSRRLLRFALPE